MQRKPKTSIALWQLWYPVFYLAQHETSFAYYNRAILQPPDGYQWEGGQVNLPDLTTHYFLKGGAL